MVSRKNAENIPDGRESNESVLKETNSQREVVVASEAGNGQATKSGKQDYVMASAESKWSTICGDRGRIC